MTAAESIRTPQSPPSFVPAFVNSCVQPRPPFNKTSNGVMIAASLSRSITKRPAMDQAHKSESENVVLDEHRFAQVCATPHKHRRNEVGNEWISESDSGVGRIFGWEIVSESKTRDYAEVKWKIAEVVQQTRAETGAVFNHCATKNLPQHDCDDSVKKKVTDRLCVGFCEEPASAD